MDSEKNLVIASTSHEPSTSKKINRKSSIPSFMRPLTRRRSTVYPNTKTAETRAHNRTTETNSNVKELFIGNSISSESDLGLTPCMEEDLQKKEDMTELPILKCVMCGDEEDLELYSQDNFCIIALKKYWQKIQLPNPYILCERCHILLKQLVEFVETYKKLHMSHTANKTNMKEKCMLCFKNKDVLYALHNNQEHLLQYFKTVALIMWVKVHPLKIDNRQVCKSCIRKLDIFVSLTKKMVRISCGCADLLSIDNLPVDFNRIGKLGCKFSRVSKPQNKMKTTVRINKQQEQEAAELLHMYDSFDEEDDYKELIVVENCLDPHDYKKIQLKMTPAYRNKNIIEDLMKRIVNNDSLLCEPNDPIVTYHKKHNLQKTIFLYHRTKKLWYEALLKAIDRLKIKNMNPTSVFKPMEFPPVNGALNIENEIGEGPSQRSNQEEISKLPLYEATLSKLPNITTRLTNLQKEIGKKCSTPVQNTLAQKRTLKTSRPRLASISSQTTKAKTSNPTRRMNPHKKLPDIKKKTK